MIEATLPDIVSFALEHFGGSAAVILFVALVSWRWSRRVAEFEATFNAMKIDIEKIKAMNIEDHKEFRHEISNLKTDVANIKGRVGII